MKYESNGDRNRILSLDKHLNTIEPQLRDILINLQDSDTGKFS